MKPTRGLWVLALAALSGGLAEAADPVTNAAPPVSMMIDGVAAQVNGDTITVAEVMSEIRNSAWVEFSKEERAARLRDLYRDTLNAFIDRKLILASAKAAEMKLQPWIVDSRIQEIIDGRFNGDRTRLLAALTERRISFDDWRKGIEEDLMLSAMRMQMVDQRVSVSPREIRGYYQTNREALRIPAGARVGRIVLSVPPKSEETLDRMGERVLKELDDGGDFASVARRCSGDSHAARGGDWGWVNPEETFASELSAALAPLKPGQHSRMVVLGDRGYIMKKFEEKSASLPTLDEAWPLIERRLRAQRSDESYREWTGRLRREAFVRVFDLPAPIGS